MEQSNNEYSYFQFNDLPIFINIEPEFNNSEFTKFLQSNKFSLVTDKTEKQIVEIIEITENSRLLKITNATPRVARQIDMQSENDRYGNESIIPSNNHNIYRYKNHALIIYSSTAKEWQMGTFDSFGKDESSLFHHRLILTRFLSWSLTPLGIVGIWGVPVEEGIVVMSPDKSNAEAVFIDVVNNRIISVEGTKSIRGHFTIIKLDSKLNGNTFTMSREEVISFLYANSSYFSYQKLNSLTCQLIQEISKLSLGLTYPEESFSPRTSLDLQKSNL